jgi:hypothetical protein
VSIIDEEFVPNNGESMLVYQENKQKRYFFFNGESLFKMFIAFDKEVVAGQELHGIRRDDAGEVRQGPAGLSHVVLHGMKDQVLDTYQWRSSEGDGLRLVDRSKFYDVYCLVIYDRSVADRQAEVKKSNAPRCPRARSSTA